MGTLFIVATPIGNLQDITLRALKVLEAVDFIACEDTRKTQSLINEFFKGREKEISKKLFSYYDQVEVQKIPQVINLIKNGKSVALLSDAGTPLISDPGFKLVREASLNNIKIESIPGPSSAISALVSSGLPTDKFLFVGFLPQKPGHRLTFLENLKISNQYINATIIFFESPHKILRTLSDLKTVFGDIEIVIARELTKIHEEVLKTKVSEVSQIYEKSKPKGEITVCFSLK